MKKNKLKNGKEKEQNERKAPQKNGESPRKTAHMNSVTNSYLIDRAASGRRTKQQGVGCVNRYHTHVSRNPVNQEGFEHILLESLCSLNELRRL